MDRRILIPRLVIDPALPDDQVEALVLDPSFSRRGLLRLAAGVAATGGLLGALTGCAGSRSSAALPGPKWPEPEPYRPKAPSTTPKVAPPSTGPGGVIPRTAWAKSSPITSRMDRMLPVRKITIHHTAIPASGLRTKNDVAAQIESIRQAHVHRKGEPFGDIGYHYVVDPMGNVWEGRALSYQGAHVAKQNENNLGIVCLGNFEMERPNDRQVRALHAFTASQMRRFNVSLRDVRTHREMAQTACPGRNLQPVMNIARSRGGVLAMG
ncbi:MAG: peptidoglycan recognition family protein [Phycisphaerales bacterium]